MKKNHAIAYATVAMSKLGYSREEIEKITNMMLIECNAHSPKEVENIADRVLFGE
ncbi:hypothetical protein ACFFIX_21140 [Metabacillus herbersteinensis]|uniref:ANTAR domain-containing protein n=1 Tax=Metabacillus herbersteinensis TaxID=283816 RepID=A0ABV6GJM0_9BACI